MQVTLKKWGNSIAARLPSSIIEEAKFALDQDVDVRVENGRVILAPVESHEYDLEALVSGITESNRHEEVSYGKPVGMETW